MSLPPSTIDKKPETEEERTLLLHEVLSQSREIIHIQAVYVTCPCGRKISLLFSYRCFYCGLWLCTECAERHFGA
jgi:hypothetical protein